MNYSSHRFCIAPMLDLTDRHARFFLRLISQHARMYSEMINAGAIVHNDSERFLAFSDVEKPIALQLGGSDPAMLKKACEIAERYPYDEINLNVGCPSPRVSSGNFGACLMQDPALVSQCVSEMMAGSSKEITIKCRIGLDDDDSIEFLQRFIETNQQTGCKTFIIHARKAWLNGLSPKENREIPPLNYPRVYAMKEQYPNLNIVINGGLTTLEQCATQLQHCDGVMVGREAYSNPYMLAELDQLLFNSEKPVKKRSEIIANMLPYMEKQLGEGVRLHHMSRHILGLFHGLPRAKQFRRYISENAHKANAGCEVIENALALLELGDDL
jgi:tRNA-dihydrouridine synthase A